MSQSQPEEWVVQVSANEWPKKIDDIFARCEGWWQDKVTHHPDGSKTVTLKRLKPEA